MIRRLYVHNFRCLENFELALGKLSSVLLIGNNGAGKTTVGVALEVLQRIGRGTSRVGDLVRPNDLCRGQSGVPLRFEVEVELTANIYTYAVAFEFPPGFRELRVSEEKLTVDGQPIFTRELAEVRLTRPWRDRESSFGIDWHLVALPIVQPRSVDDPLSALREWLAKTLILRPAPSLARGDSGSETLQPDTQVTNLGAWFSGLLASAPAAYTKIDQYLKQVMPDLQDLQNPKVGSDSRSLVLRFSTQRGTLALPFDDLSDGEKCFVISALAIAANEAYGPLLCYWDEPDSFLAPSEVGPSVTALRRAFRDRGQLIVTSHNPEVIRRFSDENTRFLHRNSHLEPTIVRPVEDIRAKGEIKGNFVDALLRGDVGA